MGSYPFFAVLYALLFGAFGAEVPFLPSYLVTKGLSPTRIGLCLAAATIAQFSFAPVAGLAADRLGTRRILALAAAASATAFSLYVFAGDFRALLLVAVIVAMATAALNPLADALAVPASQGQSGGMYGRIRGFGSAGFIAGTLASGALVSSFGIGAIIPAAVALFAAAALPVPFLPPAPRASRDMIRGGIAILLRRPAYRRVLCVAALVIGSHAMLDAFAVISWRTQEIPTTTIAILLALAVGSELVVFVTFGPGLLRRFGPALCVTSGALAGCLRWAILAESSTPWIVASSQTLHGLTFALVHLSCMRVIAGVVPRELSATAQAIYGTTSSGLASAAVTLAAGRLYADFSARAFWLGSLLCLVALPFARRLDAGARGPPPD